MRRFTTSVDTAMARISEPVIAGDHISIATNCEMPAKTMALISTVSNSVRPFAPPARRTPQRTRRRPAAPESSCARRPGHRQSPIGRGRAVAGHRLHGSHVVSGDPRSSKAVLVEQCCETPVCLAFPVKYSLPGPGRRRDCRLRCNAQYVCTTDGVAAAGERVRRGAGNAADCPG